MFKISYEIIQENLSDVVTITEEQIHYDFLLGNVFFITEKAEIKMDWEWIPLLDFAFCLSNIGKSLSKKQSFKECFEFTESGEIIEFSSEKNRIKIISSFSSVQLEMSIEIFVKSIEDFHCKISKYVRNKFQCELPYILKKYMDDRHDCI